MTFENILKTGASEFGLDLSEAELAAFLRYSSFLISENEKMNLTAITSEADIAVKHFLDSLSLRFAIDIKHNAKIIDIGTGAGFPGVPLKIVLPGTEVLLADSLAKRIAFLDKLITELSLEKISAVHMRAEEGGRDAKLRDSFDIAVSRAVARLRELCEYCLPFVKPGGFFVAMKGNDILTELDEAKSAIKALNGEVHDIKTLTLPFSDYKRNLIVIRKLRHTPIKFPRKQAQIVKTPII